MSKMLSASVSAAMVAAIVLLVAVDRSWCEPAKPKAKDPSGDAKKETDQPSIKPIPPIPTQPKPIPSRSTTLGEKTLSAEQKIEQAMSQPVALEFEETPLYDVVAFLREHHKIEMLIDTRALEDAGIGEDAPVTKTVKRISLRSALNMILRDLGLTYTIQDEVLLITTPEEADNNLLTRIYDVGDLVVARDQDGRLWDDYDLLITVITETIRPESWCEVGGPGGITPASFGSAKVLVVSQTYRNHHDIAKLLEEMRKIAKANPTDEPPLRNRPECLREGMPRGCAGAPDDAGARDEPRKPADAAPPSMGGGMF